MAITDAHRPLDFPVEELQGVGGDLGPGRVWAEHRRVAGGQDVDGVAHHGRHRVRRGQHHADHAPRRVRQRKAPTHRREPGCAPLLDADHETHGVQLGDLVVQPVVGGLAAGVGIGIAAAVEGRTPDCSSQYSTFTADLNIAANTPTTSSSWTSVNQTMFNALGAYCSCAGGLGQLGTDPQLKTDVEDLIILGRGMFSVPGSCGSF
jgi:hypothetical protein